MLVLASITTFLDMLQSLLFTYFQIPIFFLPVRGYPTDNINSLHSLSAHKRELYCSGCNTAQTNLFRYEAGCTLHSVWADDFMAAMVTEL